MACYEVRLTPQCEVYEDDLYGAFVNVWVACNTEAEFREKAAEALLAEHYEILDVGKVTVDDHGPSADICEIVMEQIEAGDLAAFGPLHCYPKDGLDA